jgi:hypothetical protein
MSSETRTIRPFVGIDALASVLDEAALYVGQESCSANQSLVVDLAPHELLLRPVSIEWATDEQGLEGFRKRFADAADTASLPLNALSIVVVASSPFLKIAEIVFDQRMTDLATLPRLVDLTGDRRSDALATPFNGFAVDAYVILAKDVRPKPLRPYRRGTWIAWSHFRVETSNAPALLPPTPLTDEVRERFRLGAKTIRFFYFGDHNVLEPYADQERPVFYIDDKLLAQLSARRKSPASKAFQLQLAQDFTTAVLRRASVDRALGEVSYDDVRTSLLGSVVRVAAGPGATDEDRTRLLGQVRDDLEYVIARAEHFIDVASGYVGALKGEE